MTKVLFQIILFTLVVLLFLVSSNDEIIINVHQSIEKAAKLCRRVLSDSGRGHLLTLMDKSISEELDGYPFGIMEYYSDKCTPHGNLLLYLSDLQLSTRNMHYQMNKVAFTITALKDYNEPYPTTPIQQPRFTLFGNITRVPKSKTQSAMSCFASTHPEAKLW
ncbi:pyridoxamine 5'-phosphate oxidase-domain-containing protein [Cokeromyces recurvatus]|uniref:pyridoxamine 5'-phosphate oxidase-domain-containing protein n=1 Tax=Cokeromyces recurvatus TaxID=90255 RepID=UPI00221F0059|nr:pyridoxamine 5'-phosphate oxidase-domain-containing protein [Cokeromyces recurvatus]KAI7900915.1 pyridoxamine 5'-phosphate oxidase-domain-containing protein [Cokeromyces recurvatus]